MLLFNVISSFNFYNTPLCKVTRKILLMLLLLQKLLLLLLLLSSWTAVIFEKVKVAQLSKNLKIMIYRTIILPVDFYGCETWSLTLREERKLRVFENMLLRRIFGPMGDEVTGEWRRLPNEELNELYCSPNIVRVIKSRRMRWAGHVARMGEESGVYSVLVGKPEGRRPLGRPRTRWWIILG